jgi:hypothetical protein
MEFRLRTICIEGLLGGQVQVLMSYETCYVLSLSSSSSGPSEHFFPLQRYPKMPTFIISLLFKIGKNDGGIEITGVCVKCTSFPSLPLLGL